MSKPGIDIDIPRTERSVSSVRQACPNDDQNRPYWVYSVPDLSCVGLSKESVRLAGNVYECGTARFRETSHGRIMGLDDGVLKLIRDRSHIGRLSVRSTCGCPDILQGTDCRIDMNGNQRKSTRIQFVKNPPKIAKQFLSQILGEIAGGRGVPVMRIGRQIQVRLMIRATFHDRIPVSDHFGGNASADAIRQQFSNYRHA